MRNKLTSFVLLFFIFIPSIYGQGTRIDDGFYSTSLNKLRMVDVYLPPGYDHADKTIRYPVIYFLHGASGNQNSYSFFESIANLLIANKTIEPVILVKPDGSTEPWAGSFYTNTDLYGPFEDYIVNDLVTFIDKKYNTIKSREKRSIMGHSMGGFGAMKLFLKHPTLFTAVAAHSGPLHFDPIIDQLPEMLVENGGSGPFEPNAGRLTELMFSMAGAFSPNLKNPPNFVDLILTDSGEIIDSTKIKWWEQSPAHLATQFSPDSNFSIFFDCGDQDELGVFPMNTKFAETLDSLAIPHEFQEYSGNHFDKLFDRFPISLQFLNSKMNVISGSEIYTSTIPQSVILYQNYPNPFSAGGGSAYGGKFNFVFTNR